MEIGKAGFDFPRGARQADHGQPRSAQGAGLAFLRAAATSRLALPFNILDRGSFTPPRSTTATGFFIRQEKRTKGRSKGVRRSALVFLQQYWKSVRELEQDHNSFASLAMCPPYCRKPFLTEKPSQA